MKLCTLYNNTNHISLLVALIMAMISQVQSRAFSPDVYTGESVLASGRWVKISVPETGIYLITTSQLRKWGFSNPDAVRIHGYGGNRISDVLSIENYRDDLPPVQSAVTSRGIVFYSEGPVSWSDSGTHTENPYSTAGYYFLTENTGTERPEIPANGNPDGTTAEPESDFRAHLLHEVNALTMAELGHQLVGEDFLLNPSQQFRFTLTDRIEGSDVEMRCSFVMDSPSGSNSLVFTANGETLPTASADNLGATPSSSYYHGISTVTSKTFSIEGSSLNLGIALRTSSRPNKAHLDYIEIGYTRAISLGSAPLCFTANRTAVSMATRSTQRPRVWDVTDPLAITELTLTGTGETRQWVNEYTGRRRYAAWDEASGSIPSPAYVGTVSNQNLHAMEPVDMVIFHVPEFKAQAERLAEIHRNGTDSLSVAVVDQTQVFNEFSSGSADPNGFRRMLKMLYDRSHSAAGGPRLRYALMFGRGIFDNRQLTSQGRLFGRNRMPIWMTDTALDENSAYTTDDIFAFLDDNSGLRMQSDELSIAVGRIPATTTDEARIAVDKINEYLYSMPKDAWKNRIMVLADDGNNGDHVDQAEKALEQMLEHPNGRRFTVEKIYIDAFELREGGYPDARNKMFATLNDGVMMWMYIGHGNPNLWTGEKILLFDDMRSLYLKRYPMVYAATCDFLKWDNNVPTGAEYMQFLPGGGCIAMISATRPVYISENGKLSKEFGAVLPQTEADGRLLTIGELYRRTKNRLPGNTNKLRFVLMGDPALRMPMPAQTMRIDEINGKKFDPEEQPTLMAAQSVEIKGAVVDTEGSVVGDFNGTIMPTLYDAEYSSVTLAHGKEGKEMPFDQQGSMLYTGKSAVTDGTFSLNFAMPSEIANNFRPGALNLYAYDADSGAEASDCVRSLYVYGLDETSEADTQRPVISDMVLNHPTFASGDATNESPLLMATVSDNRSINLSEASIGHRMVLTLDDRKTYTDVAQYYTPELIESGDSGSKGTINYPLSDLTDGHHTLRLRVWDTSANYAEQTIEFNVQQGLTPRIFDVLTDTNPADTHANFYVRHDRPESLATVIIEIFDLMGRKVWETTSTGRSDMFLTAPATWDLTDMSGRRVRHGIYVYRATFYTTDAAQQRSASRKLAVR